LVQAIACDQQKMFTCSVFLDGEFGLNDLCIGVPVILGKNGIEQIVEIKLDEAELNQLQVSAEGVKATNTLLNDLNL
jgi:malate dehydrogenase